MRELLDQLGQLSTSVTNMNVAASKRHLRTALFDARKSLSPAQQEQENALLRRNIATLIGELAPRRVAAYMPTATEPGGADLVNFLSDLGLSVIVPLSRADFSLDFIEVAEDTEFQPGPFGIPEPMGSALPGNPLHDVDLIFVPALAVDRHGFRLGKGGGYYDRALAKVPDVPTATIVFSAELLDKVPREDHDLPTSFIITPQEILRTNATFSR